MKNETTFFDILQILEKHHLYSQCLDWNDDLCCLNLEASAPHGGQVLIPVIFFGKLENFIDEFIETAHAFNINDPKKFINYANGSPDFQAVQEDAQWTREILLAAADSLLETKNTLKHNMKGYKKTMKINRIEIMNPENLVASNALTEKEFLTLEYVLNTLIKCYRFHEELFFHGYETPNYAKRIFTPEFAGIAVNSESELYQLEDYLISSVYLTESDQVIITAYSVVSSSLDECLQEKNLCHFLVSDLDTDYVTEELYYCFITDVAMPTVEL